MTCNRSARCTQLLLFLVLSAGCTDATDPETQGAAAIPANDETDPAGVVKIAVMTDGTVEVNSEAVPIDSLSTMLDTLGDIQEVWYYRESPEAAEPHENAIKVIDEIADRKLPIAFYVDRDFTEPLARSTFD